MKKQLLIMMGCILATAFMQPQFSAQLLAAQKKANTKPEKDPPLRLKVGDSAPDFTLLSFDGKDLKKVSLHEFRGKKNVALAFYVFAFTGG
ncbi:MAG TPA: hypothetical protein VFA76_12340 [Terriglobales bacterium]|nr:hypothetical protein [Terriglobales bacterium]